MITKHQSPWLIGSISPDTGSGVGVNKSHVSILGAKMTQMENKLRTDQSLINIANVLRLELGNKR